MREDLVPDVSLGPHFFNELVELDILYLALFPGRDGNWLNEEFFEQAPNRLSKIMPSAADWSHVVRVLEPADLPGGGLVQLNANNLSQRVVCYRRRNK